MEENVLLHAELNPPSQKPTYSLRNKKTIFLISFLVLLLSLLGLKIYVSSHLQEVYEQVSTFDRGTNLLVVPSISLSPTPIVMSKKPHIAVFMRNGQIWKKNFMDASEKLISKSSPVGYPMLSPDGMYILYQDIIHFAGGFARYSLYVSDTNGTFEKVLPLAYAPGISKLLWSKDSRYFGVVLFSETFPLTQEAFLFDTALKKEISLGKATKKSQEISDDIFTLTSSCEKQVAHYREFCEEYNVFVGNSLKKISPDDTTNEYEKKQDYQASTFTKQNYKLTTYKMLDNDLVHLEYYSGEPQNPEAAWGIGGGSFVPGYDKGVTQTYTLLIDKTTGTVLQEIPQAINTVFF